MWGTTGPSTAPNLVKDENGNFWIDFSQPFWTFPANDPGEQPAPPGSEPTGNQTGSPNGPSGGPGQGNPDAGDGSSAPALTPREVALEVLHEVSLPNATVRMSPTTGLVALPTWFWVDGYDGRPFGSSRTISLPPLIGSDVPFSVVPANDPRRQGTSFTVDVRVWPTRYDWSFGDGATLVSQSLGQAYPQESEVRHTYQRSSLGFASGYPVQLTVQFGADYSVNGGPRQPLAATQRTFSAGVRIRESQAVLTGR